MIYWTNITGANCAFPGCNVSRYKLHNGTTIFIIAKKKSEFYQERRKEILRVLLKYRDIDLVLKKKNCKWVMLVFLFPKDILLPMTQNIQVVPYNLVFLFNVSLGSFLRNVREICSMSERHFHQPVIIKKLTCSR